jgi:hypothetical protein
MDDLIKHYIDKNSFSADTDFAKAQLADLEAAYTRLKNSRINLKDATGTSNIVNSATEAKAAIDQLRIKNLELTNSIKEQQLAIKQAAEERKQQIADEKEAAKQAAIAGQEKLRALEAQKKAEEDLISVQKERQDSDIGTYDIQQGSGQAGGAKLKTSSTTPVAATASNRQESLIIDLAQTQQLLKQNQTAQKDLNDQLDKGAISQAKYDAAIIEAKQEELDYKATISATSAELKARQTLNNAAAGSIDAAKAQNVILTQQRNSIPVGDGATAEDLERLKSINSEIDKNNDLIDKNSDLLARQKINIGNYPNAFSDTFKTLNTELDSVQGKLVSGNFKGGELDQLTAKFNVLTNATALTGKSFSSTGAQSKAFTEAGIQIGQVYGKNSDFFKQFSAGVREGNVNIKGLASEVSGVATKGAGFMSFLSGAYNGIRKLAYAIPGIGIAGIILLMLGPLQAAGAAFIKWRDNATEAGKASEDMKKKTEELNTVVKAGVGDYGKAVESVSQLAEEIKLAKEGFLDKDEVLKHYNETIGKTTGQVNTLDKAEANLEKNGEAFIHLMLLKSEAVAAYAEAAKAAQKAVTAQQDAENDFGVGSLIKSNRDNLSFIDKLKSIFLPYDTDLVTKEMAASQKTINDNANANKNEAEKTFEDFRKLGDKIMEQAAAWAKGHGLKFFPEGATKDAAKSAADLSRLLDQSLKKDLEEIAKANKLKSDTLLAGYIKDYENEENSFKDRLDALKKFYDESQKLITDELAANDQEAKRKEDQDLSKADGIKNVTLREKTIAQIKKTYADTITADKLEALKKQNDLDGSYSDKTEKIVKEEYDYIGNTIKNAYEEISKAIDDASKRNTANNNISKNNQLLQLDKDFQNGSIKSIEEYNKKKKSIEDAASEQDILSDEDTIKEKLAATVEGSLQRLKLLGKYSDDEVKLNEIKNAKILASDKEIQEEKKELLEKEIELGNQALTTLSAFVDAGYQKQKDANDQAEKDLDAKTQHEIDLVNSSTLSEQQKADSIVIINARAAAQKDQLDKKQKEADIQKAKFDKAMAILRIGIATAEAVALISAKAAALFPLGTLLLAQIPLIIAEGALEIAAVVAAPIPQFKYGKKDSYSGLAIVDDGGKNEPIYRAATGQFEISTGKAKDRLTYLDKNDIVFPDVNNVHDMLIRMAMPKVSGLPVSSNSMHSELNSLGKKMDIMTNVIKTKKELHFTAAESAYTAIWRHGSSKTKYLDEQTNW